jgi:hypothetical protein
MSAALVVSSASAQQNPSQTAPTTQPTQPPADNSTPPVTASPLTAFDDAEVPAFFTSKYTPEPDKASKEKPTASWRWSGSEYFQQIGVSPPFCPGCTQTFAPTVDTFVLLQPKFSFDKNWQLRVRMTASYEFTNNADTTTTRANELDFGDIIPTLAFRGIPKFWGIKTIIAAGTALPTSPASQARTMITSPVVQVAFNKTFEHVLKGDIDIGIIGSYSHPFYRYTTSGLNDTPAYEPACFNASDSGCGLQAGGAANTENSLTVGATASWTWGKFSVSALFYLFNQWVYQFSPEAGVEPEPGGSVPFRQFSYFNAALGWEFTNFFSAEVGYQMYRSSVLTGESQIGNPFYDPYQDMRIYAGIDIKLDKLYDAARGIKDKDENHGIVHVRNERKPEPSSL